MWKSQGQSKYLVNIKDICQNKCIGKGPHLWQTGLWKRKTHPTHVWTWPSLTENRRGWAGLGHQKAFCHSLPTAHVVFVPAHRSAIRKGWPWVPTPCHFVLSPISVKSTCNTTIEKSLFEEVKMKNYPLPLLKKNPMFSSSGSKPLFLL